ncbi:MAG: histidinol-phosphate transaminase [Clostridiales bacterium]|jgi:histidinol-phosphate aminotransferase|nr:histidinol-phosphate transaminase [Clostridiales bacterium]
MINYRQTIKPMTPYVPGRPIEDVKREFGLTDVVKLASNENPLGCSPRAKEAIIKSLKDTNYYPDGNCTKLRDLLAKSLGIKPTEIVFGCGADEVLAMVGKVFVNPGDECITGEETFSQYAASVVSMDGVMIYAPMKNHAFDLDAIISKITDKTKVIFIANPNNPTGSAFTQAEEEVFLKKVPSNIVVVMDEAYAEFASDPDYPQTLDMLRKYKNVILIKTFSKIYGLASLRVGYGIADENLINLFEKVRPPFNVTIQAQEAAYAAYLDRDFVRKAYENNRSAIDYYCKEMDAIGVNYIPSQANFVMTDTGYDSLKVFYELMKKGYIVRPGAPFGMDTWIRVTMGTLEQMRGFVRVVRDSCR